MVRQQFLIVLALIGVFISLGALVWAIDGLIFDNALALRCGGIIVAVSIAGVVALLNIASKGEG